jgi:hypothetical protein
VRNVWTLGYPPPGWFWAKSAELIEEKRVAFLTGAKKRKRVRKDMKTKGIGIGKGETRSEELEKEGRSEEKPPTGISAFPGRGWFVTNMHNDSTKVT